VRERERERERDREREREREREENGDRLVDPIMKAGQSQNLHGECNKLEFQDGKWFNSG
jgi:hypothetical protein